MKLSKILNFILRKNNNHGLSIIETMVAAALSLAGVLAVGTAVKYVKEKNHTTQYISSMMTIEFQLVSAFINADNYTSQDKTDLTSNAVPTRITLKTYGNLTPDLHLGTNYITDTNDPTVLRTPCTTAGFDDPKCIFKIDIDIKFTGPFFYYAYRISLNPKYSNVVSLGSNPTYTSELFASSDYRIQIPPEIYPPAANADLSCSAQGKMIANGFLNGRLICINKSRPIDECPANTFAKYLEVVNDTGEKYLKLHCVPSVSACCPQDYVLKKIDFTSTDSINSPNASSNQCVFAAKKIASPTPATKGPAYSIRGEVCPPKYKSNSTCRLTQGVIGLCNPTLPANINSGRSATCEVNGLIADCVNAKVTLNVVCELDTASYPETVPATSVVGACPAQTPDVYVASGPPPVTPGPVVTPPVTPPPPPPPPSPTCPIGRACSEDRFAPGAFADCSCVKVAVCGNYITSPSQLICSGGVWQPTCPAIPQINCAQ